MQPAHRYLFFNFVYMKTTTNKNATGKVKQPALSPQRTSSPLMLTHYVQPSVVYSGMLFWPVFHLGVFGNPGWRGLLHSLRLPHTFNLSWGGAKRHKTELTRITGPSLPLSLLPWRLFTSKKRNSSSCFISLWNDGHGEAIPPAV